MHTIYYLDINDWVIFWSSQSESTTPSLIGYNFLKRKYYSTSFGTNSYHYFTSYCLNTWKWLRCSDEVKNDENLSWEERNAAKLDVDISGDIDRSVKYCLKDSI